MTILCHRELKPRVHMLLFRPMLDRPIELSVEEAERQHAPSHNHHALPCGVRVGSTGPHCL
eukprot:CAMPEP_0175979836 /NCGR_PEP_ID=MMETSP0108-20121206/46461_1 /TAXON_ID=195067 ORGANISM="Goniomonas pacifica, Strain CCMP1869" /NCGR_SAMPLE_ID=MMETSP0108 /ASSEMBLY_ACC=CAM_ASM_000204 /LENGTH=60 /DNA_ID=CAMNT_0017310219 /DNA_START=192 /DNA_END=374 /DNA_ORIENTATION=-